MIKKAVNLSILIIFSHVREHNSFSSNLSDGPGKETSIDFIRLKFITIIYG